MNFFNVGIVLCSIDLSVSTWLNYTLKLVGALFMLAGIREAQTVSEGFDKYSGGALLSLALSVVGLAASLLTDFSVLSGTISNICLTASGVLCTGMIIYNQSGIISHMTPKHELVNDPSLLNNLDRLWKRLTFFRIISLVCEASARFIPEGNIQTFIQTVLIIVRIIMYFYVVFVALAFNRVRMDFNATHPI